MDMAMVVTAIATAATAGQATHTMDTEVTTSVMPMVSQATEVMVMEATPGSATAMDTVMVVTAMATAATAGQVTPTMDMAATTSVMLMLSQVMADMDMEDTQCPGSAMVMAMAATAMVIA